MQAFWDCGVRTARRSVSGAGSSFRGDGNLTMTGVATARSLLLLPTDMPPTCDSAAEGGIYYDDSLDELCVCNGSTWR